MRKKSTIIVTILASLLFVTINTSLIDHSTVTTYAQHGVA